MTQVIVKHPLVCNVVDDTGTVLAVGREEHAHALAAALDAPDNSVVWATEPCVYLRNGSTISAGRIYPVNDRTQTLWIDDDLPAATRLVELLNSPRA